MQERQVLSLGQEDPLEEEEMATCSSILARKIPRTEEPGGLWSMGLQRLDMTEHVRMPEFIAMSIFHGNENITFRRSLQLMLTQNCSFLIF